MVGLALGQVPGVRAATLSVDSDAMTAGRYDDNIDRVGEDRREDFTLSLGVALVLSVAAQRLSASGRYGLTTEFFSRRTEDEPELAHSAALAVAATPTRRLTVRGAGSFSYAETTEPDARLAIPAPSPAGDVGPVLPEPPPAVPAGSIPTRRVQRVSGVATGEADFEYDANTRIGANYSAEISRFDAPDLVDTDVHRIGLIARREVGRADRIGLAYALALFEFEAPSRRDRRSDSVSVNWGHDFSRTLTGSASAGVTVADREEPGRSAVLSGTGLASVERRGEFTRYAVTYERAVTSTGGTGELSTRDRLSAGVSHQLSLRLGTSVGAAYARNRPLDGITGPVDSYSATGAFEVRLRPWLRAHAEYTFERAVASEAGRSFRNNRVSAGVSVTYPVLRTGQF